MQRGEHRRRMLPRQRIIGDDLCARHPGERKQHRRDDARPVFANRAMKEHPAAIRRDEPEDIGESGAALRQRLPVKAEERVPSPTSCAADGSSPLKSEIL